MRMKQTEEKITALYERLSRDDDNAGDSREATPTAATIPMTDGAAVILTVPHGNGWWRTSRPERLPMSLSRI